jgi:hypothetical protein
MKPLWVIAVLFAFTASAPGCANASKAEAYAASYMAEFRPSATVVGIRCDHTDSDSDGRVRCNIGYTGPTIGPTVEHVACPSGWLWQPFTTTCVGQR